jgi:hypothetical protein
MAFSSCVVISIIVSTAGKWPLAIRIHLILEFNVTNAGSDKDARQNVSTYIFIIRLMRSWTSTSACHPVSSPVWALRVRNICFWICPVLLIAPDAGCSCNGVLLIEEWLLATLLLSTELDKEAEF